MASLESRVRARGDTAPSTMARRSLTAPARTAADDAKCSTQLAAPMVCLRGRAPDECAQNALQFAPPTRALVCPATLELSAVPAGASPCQEILPQAASHRLPIARKEGHDGDGATKPKSSETATATSARSSGLSPRSPPFESCSAGVTTLCNEMSLPLRQQAARATGTIEAPASVPVVQSEVLTERVDGEALLRRFAYFKRLHFPPTEAAPAARNPVSSLCRLSPSSPGSGPALSRTPTSPPMAISPGRWGEGRRSEVRVRSAGESPRTSPASSAAYVFPSTGAALPTLTPLTLQREVATHSNGVRASPPPPAMERVSSLALRAAPTSHRQQRQQDVSSHFYYSSPPPSRSRSNTGASSSTPFSHPVPSGIHHWAIIQQPELGSALRTSPSTSSPPLSSFQRALFPSEGTTALVRPQLQRSVQRHSSLNHVNAAGQPVLDSEGDNYRHGQTLDGPTSVAGSSGWWMRPDQNRGQLQYASDDSPWLALHRNETVARTLTHASNRTAVHDSEGSPSLTDLLTGGCLRRFPSMTAMTPAPQCDVATMVEVGVLHPYSPYEKMLLSGNHADVVLAVTEAVQDVGIQGCEGALNCTPGQAPQRRKVTLFRAHRLVLSHMSPFFETLLYHNNGGVLFPGEAAHEESDRAEPFCVGTLAPRGNVLGKDHFTDESDEGGRHSSRTLSLAGESVVPAIPAADDDRRGALVPVIELSPQLPVVNPAAASESCEGGEPASQFPLTPKLLATVLLYMYTGVAPLISSQVVSDTENGAPDANDDGTVAESTLSPQQLSQRHSIEYVHLLWASEYFMLSALTASLRAALPDFLTITSAWPVLAEARRLGLASLAEASETWVRQHVWAIIRDTDSFVELEPCQVASLITYHHRRFTIPVPGEGHAATGDSQRKRSKKQSLVACDDLARDAGSAGSPPDVSAATLPPQTDGARLNSQLETRPFGAAIADALPTNLLTPSPNSVRLLGTHQENQQERDQQRFSTQRLESVETSAGSAAPVPHDAEGRRTAMSPLILPSSSPAAAASLAGSVADGPATTSVPAPSAHNIRAASDSRHGADEEQQRCILNNRPKISLAKLPSMPLPPTGASSSVIGESSAGSLLRFPPTGVFLGPTGGHGSGSNNDTPSVRLFSTHPLILPPSGAQGQLGGSQRTAPLSTALGATAMLTETEVMRAVLLWLEAWRFRRNKPTLAGGDLALESAVTTTIGALHWESVDQVLMESEVLPLLRELTPGLQRATVSSKSQR